MKSLLSVLLVVVLIVAVTHGQETAKIDERLKAQLNIVFYCKNKENATMDDVNAFLQWNMPETREGHCMVACAAESTGMIKDGKLSPEGTVRTAKFVIREDAPNRVDVIEVLGNAAEECTEIVGSEDRCELILEIVECMFYEEVTEEE